ncbi:hypothetical protein HYS91_04370 [Candidatus Daviesbacteria bacterium]|nr:hypothetical protein [Candidatus Daviesbacteria bacterium]
MTKPKEDKKFTVPESIIKNLLTPSEIRMVKNRYFIIQLLSEGLSIRSVAKKAKVGTDTVVRVARLMEKSNLKKNIVVKKTSKTSWVFGKGNE